MKSQKQINKHKTKTVCRGGSVRGINQKHHFIHFMSYCDGACKVSLSRANAACVLCARRSRIEWFASFVSAVKRSASSEPRRNETDRFRTATHRKRKLTAFELICI